jgi:DnaJ family protein C protein 7
MTNKKNKQAKKKQAAANGTASASTTNGIDLCVSSFTPIYVNIQSLRHLIYVSKTPEPMNIDSPSPAPSTSQKTPPPKTPPPPPETDAQKLTRADKVKEQGNTAFKAGKFDEAIEFYSKAIGTDILNLYSMFTNILRRNTTGASLSHKSSSILHGH